MTRITIEPKLIEQIESATDQVEFCDADGNFVGYLMPVTKGDRPGTWRGKLEIPFTDEQIAASRRNKTGRTLQEIFDSIDSK